MKLPSGYGQIIKLSGKRRRPYAVRIDAGVERAPDGHYVRKQKYFQTFLFLENYSNFYDVMTTS